MNVMNKMGFLKKRVCCMRPQGACETSIFGAKRRAPQIKYLPNMSITKKGNIHI